MIIYDVYGYGDEVDNYNLLLEKRFNTRDEALLFIDENLEDFHTMKLIYRTDRPKTLHANYMELEKSLSPILLDYVNGIKDFDDSVEEILTNIDYMYDVYERYEDDTNPLSLIETGIETYCMLWWGYTDLLNIDNPLPYKVGDIVDTRYQNMHCRCIIMAGGSFKDHIRDGKYSVLNWKPSMAYYGYDKNTGVPVYIIYENYCHYYNEIVEEEPEEYSYMWILREFVLGRCELTEDEVKAICFGEVNTNLNPHPMYYELPSISSYIQKHKEAKG